MRLHLLSDLHFDARRQTWRTFIDEIPSDIADVLVVAGDLLCMSDRAAPEMLASVHRKARDVIYVLGNHEHFHGVFSETKATAQHLCAQVGIHLLDGSAVTVRGQRFLGGTLWFAHQPEALHLRPLMMDFRVITDLEDAVYEENTRTRAFLMAQAKPTDVVVTHHLPTPASVAAKYRSLPDALLNPFFLCDCEDIIQARRPALWLHGHTHTPCDHLVHATRVVCNPIGYPGEQGTGRLDCVIDL